MELRRGKPPDHVLDRAPSQIFLNLLRLADTPGEWGQVSSHPNKRTAQQTAYQLRKRQRKVPPGTWEFLYGPVDRDNAESRYGVWARFISKESEESATPDVGGEHSSP